MSALACILAAGAQEEAGRPVGEVTREMHQQHYAPRPGPRMFPTPQEIHETAKPVELGPKAAYTFTLELAGEARRLTLLPAELTKRIAARHDARPGRGGGARIVFALNARDLPVDRERMGRHLATLTQPEGHVISPAAADGRDYILVLGKTENALWRALATLAQAIEAHGDALRFPAIEIIDYPQMERRGLLVDIGGQGFMVGPSRWELPRWKEYIDWMVDQKFNEIWLEFIGSGRLMGNLSMEAGEWIGFPLALESYPQLVARDRPLRRWDEAKQQIVQDKYTAPNVRQDFVRELIDYAQARGVRCVLLIGYDYFANQLPVVLGIPANDPSHPEANKVYDTLLREIVQRYDNAQGVCLITIENKNVPPWMVDEVVRRVHEGRAIVKSINPRMDVGVLNDYLEWRPREELDRYVYGIPADVYQMYSPHAQPQNKSWKRIAGDVYRYELYTQYAWNHVAYIFPERIKREIQEAHIDGYRKVVSQAWYFDVFELNFLTMAEMTWNSTGTPLDVFWDATLERVFGPAAKDAMRTAFAHTRFDIRSDIVSRMILNDHFDRPFRFWDMYTLTNIDGLKDPMLAALEVDARASLAAVQRALPLVTATRAREMAEVTLKSAERRLYLATSARQLLKARAAAKAGDRAAALAAMDECLREAAKLERAATKLGIEYPMATHDDEVIAKYRQYREELLKKL